MCPTADVGGELIDCRKIIFFEVRVLVENLRLGHAGAKPAEDVPNYNPQAADARCAAAFARFDGNSAAGRRCH